MSAGGTAPMAWVLFDYSYVSNESNIYRKTFDHRSGGAYNEYPDVSGMISIGLRVLLIMTAIRRVL